MTKKVTKEVFTAQFRG